jgi:Cys-tRNA(Pro)/Cys-tRNA(Cys) deacylase
VPVALEQTALDESSVYINGGQRGLQIELDANDARRVLEAIVAALVV